IDLKQGDIERRELVRVRASELEAGVEIGVFLRSAIRRRGLEDCRFRFALAEGAGGCGIEPEQVLRRLHAGLQGVDHGLLRWRVCCMLEADEGVERRLE